MNFPGMTGIGAAVSSPKFGGPGVAAGAGTGPGGTDPNDPTVKMVQGAMESCYVKTVMSGVVGFGLGGVFGLFMASMAYDTPYHTAVPTPDAAAPAAAAAKGAPAAAATTTAATAKTPAAATTTTTATTIATSSTAASSAAKPTLSVPVPKGAAAPAAIVTAGAGAGAGTVTQSAILNPTYAALSNLPLREQLRRGFRDMGSRSWSTAKNFGTVGALFSGIECGIEGLRAKNDIANGVAAGCLTGAILARNAGPQAAAVGCAGFAAFSAAIDAYMRMPPSDD